MAEGDGAVDGDGAPAERVRSPFQAGPLRDSTDVASVCRFLALETGQDVLEPARSGIDTAHRCVAIGDPVAQSARQQELVCLTAAHANCPRFLRGLLAAGPPLPVPPRQAMSPAVIGSVLVLAATLAMSFGFLAIRGGFTVPLASRSPAQIAVATASPSPAPSPTAPPTPSPTATPSPSPTPSASPTLGPSPLVTPAATPTVSARPPTPRPSSDRFALLTACPGQSDCWIYVIRSGDNLQSIANYFGVSFDRMMAMNPNLRTPIHAGDQLKIPTPTR
ncbi:MAG: LysM peptidoglycan-binding domain-containing protein [Candidatus Limnocylindrales bacterium]